MRKLFLLLFISQIGYANCLDFQTAWQRILTFAPSIAAADSEVEALKGQAEQLALMLNPVFEVESENLGISHPSDKTEPPQTTFSLSQILELGGKRAARFQLASSQSCVAYLEAQIEREDALFDLETAFIEVRIAEERLYLAQEKVALSECILNTLKQQIKNGKLSPIQEKKGQIQWMMARSTLKDAFSTLEQAKLRLASMWGSSCPDFERVEFDIFTFCPQPCQTQVMDGFYQTAIYRKAQQLLASAENNLYLQKVNGIPNLTLMFGYRYFHDSHRGGWVVGAEMPLPIFDRNQGSICSAWNVVRQAEYELEEVIREAEQKISLLYEKLLNSYEEGRMLANVILADAEETFKLTQQGYQNGKFDYLDVLDANKMLLEFQEKYIDVLCEYHLQRAELARLSGGAL